MIYGSMAGGWNWMPGETFTVAFTVVFGCCWFGSQAAVVVAAGRVWRRLERGPAGGEAR